MSSRHPIARAEPVPDVVPAALPLIGERNSSLDLRPFEQVLPLLAKDVADIYGQQCRLVPMSVWERLYSHVLRTGIWHAGDEAPREHLFVKVSKLRGGGGSSNAMRARIEKDFAVTQHVYERMAAGEAYGAVRPVAYYPAHLAIVTEEVPGDTLLNVIQHTIKWAFLPRRSAGLQDALAATGRWIRDFQEPAEGSFGGAWIRDYVDLRLQRIATARRRQGADLRDRVLRHIDRVAGGLPSEPAVTVHADLSPSNVMVCENRVVVLDFAMARPGHPLQDVARLYTQLDLLVMKPQFRSALVQPLQRALLRGFDPSLRVEAPAFRLQVLAQRINHLGSLLTKRYGVVETAYNQLVVWQHWRWIERETAAGSPKNTAAWG